MVKTSLTQFRGFVSEAIDAIPPRYQERLQNVAFIVEDKPTPEQRAKLHLHGGQLLFGLYEGVPLPSRAGTTKLLPDKITLFKSEMESISLDQPDLRRRVHNTIWHEVAHYYGLDHTMIHKLENKTSNDKKAPRN